MQLDDRRGGVRLQQRGYVTVPGVTVDAGIGIGRIKIGQIRLEILVRQRDSAGQGNKGRSDCDLGLASIVQLLE